MANFVYGYGTSGITALKFNAPLNEQIVDPTTIEGFKMSFSGTVVYDKPKNFKNTFVNYDIASVDTYEDYKNAFYVNSGSTDSNLTSANDYYICDGGDWGEIYAVSGKTVRFPYPTDLEQKIEDGFPVKFHFTQYDKDENGFWNSLYNTMDNVEIKDTYWASDLFNSSNVPKMNLTFNPQVKTENGSTVIASTNAVLDSCFENCTDLQSVKLTRKGDTNTFNTLKKVFKNCSSLSALTFDAVDNNGDASNTKWNVGQLSNTFNGCEKLTSWPNNIVISGTEFDSTYANDNVVEMDYAFEGAGFQTIGSAEEFNVGKAQHAFNTSSAVTINSVMDMRYIHPEVQSHVDTMFGNHKIETISLKNINHNAWNFDGVSNGRTSQYIGDCSLFNQASVEYLFNNLYDLTSNNLEENILQRKPTIPLFSEWTTGGTGVVVNDNQVTFNDANGTLSVSNANDTFFKFSVSNMSSGDKLTVDGGLNSLEITENGNYYVNVTASTCMITANNVSSSIVVNYITSWNGAVSDVTASTLYCPSEWDNSNNNRIIDDEMITIATNRGWMVYVGNELHTVRVEVVLADNSLTVGNTTTASVYFVRTRGQQETRTEITNNTGITYYSTDSNVASVDSNGTVTANGNGTAYIYVTFNGLTSSIVDNNAKEEVTSTEYWQLILTPTTASVSETNPTAQFTATYRHYLNGTTTDTDVTHDTGTTWTMTGDGANYTTLSEGLVTWTSNPATNVTGTISASYNGTLSNTNPIVTVVHTVQEEYRLVLSPNSNIIYTINDTVEYTASYQLWQNGSFVSSADVTTQAIWAVSGNASDYTTINQGVVTKTGATSTEQSGTIYAIYNGTPQYNNPDITIKYDTTYQLRLTINKASINVGETANCTTRIYEYHDEIQATSSGVTFDSDYSSDDTSVATVVTGIYAQNGKITGIGGGTANITASYTKYGTPYTATASITVNDVTTYAVEVTAPSVEVGQTGQCSAVYVTYVNGSETSRVNINPTAATWSVTNSSILSIGSNNGIITGNTVGSTEIYCVYQGTTGHTTGYVTSASLSYITVTITAAPEIPAKGGTINCSTPGVEYEVVAHYSDNSTGFVETFSIVDCSAVTASDRENITGATISDVGTLKVKVQYEGLQAVSGRTISQEANEVESTVVHSSWTHNGNIETGNTDYYISGTNLSISNLSADGGTNVSNPVSGYSVTHYTMPRSAMTEYEVTYTSEYKDYVTSAETMANSAWTTTNNSEPVSVKSNPSWISNITTGTTGKFNYASNPDTSTRSGNIIYQLTNHTASTWTTSVQQNAATNYYIEFRFSNNSHTVSASTANQQVFQGTVRATNQGWRFVGDSSEITMSPSTGNAGTTNVTITAKTNTSFVSRLIDFNVEGTVADDDWGQIYQPGKEVILTSITVNVSSAPDIPASGGSVTYLTNGVSYTVTGNYNDGTTSNLKTSATISSNTVSANSKGTTVSSRNSVGTLTITATKDGVTGSGNITVYQELNRVENHGTETGTTTPISSAWTVNGSTYYTLTVNPSSKSVSCDAGSTGITVVASAHTPTTAYTANVHYNTSTPWSGYTSTASGYGETITDTSNPQLTNTGATRSTGHTSTSSTASSNSGWVSATNPSSNNSTVTYSDNRTSDSRTGIITYKVNADNSVSGTFTLTQDAYVVTGLTVTISNVPVIPASGGNVTCNDVTYTVVAKYNNGDTANTEDYEVIDCSAVTASDRGTTPGAARTAGTLKVKVRHTTFTSATGIGSASVTQEANAVTSAWTNTEIVDVAQSAWTQNGTTYYDIDVNPSQASVNDSNGTLNVSVSSSAITPVSAFTCDTWKVASTPYSAYTSTAIRTGTTTTGSVQNSGTTYTQGTLSVTSTPSKVFANGPEWVTASTSNIKYAAFTEGSTSARTSTTVYNVTAAPSVRESCEITQTRTTRNVTVNFTDDWYISTTLTGTPNVAVSMAGDTGAGAGDSSGEMTINTPYPLSLAGQSLIKIIDNTATTVEVLIQFALDYTLTGNNYINATSGGSTYGISGNHLFDGGDTANINMYIPISKGQYDTSVNVGSISWSVHS